MKTILKKAFYILEKTHTEIKLILKTHIGIKTSYWGNNHISQKLNRTKTKYYEDQIL